MGSSTNTSDFHGLSRGDRPLVPVGQSPRVRLSILVSGGLVLIFKELALIHIVVPRWTTSKSRISRKLADLPGLSRGDWSLVPEVQSPRDRPSILTFGGFVLIFDELAARTKTRSTAVHSVKIVIYQCTLLVMVFTVITIVGVDHMGLSYCLSMPLWLSFSFFSHVVASFCHLPAR